MKLPCKLFHVEPFIKLYNANLELFPVSKCADRMPYKVHNAPSKIPAQQAVEQRVDNGIDVPQKQRERNQTIGNVHKLLIHSISTSRSVFRSAV